MWLDRLSANQGGSGTSTPYNNRAYSPARRTPQSSGDNKPIRPTFSPRTSSLSFASTPNASTSSLPGTRPQQSNGLLARRDGARSQDANTPDPLDVLNSILGRALSSNDSNSSETDAPILEKPGTLVDSIDFGELSLEEFAEQTEDGAGETPHNKYDLQSVEQCEARMAIGTFDNLHVNTLVYIDERERERFQDLHNSIAVCTIPVGFDR